MTNNCEFCVERKKERLVTHTSTANVTSYLTDNSVVCTHAMNLVYTY